MIIDVIVLIHSIIHFLNGIVHHTTLLKDMLVRMVIRKHAIGRVSPNASMFIFQHKTRNIFPFHMKIINVRKPPRRNIDMHNMLSSALKPDIPFRVLKSGYRMQNLLRFVYKTRNGISFFRTIDRKSPLRYDSQVSAVQQKQPIHRS